MYLKCTKCGHEEKVFCVNGDDVWTTGQALQNFISKHLICTVEQNVAGKMKDVQQYPQACFLLISKEDK